MNNRQQFHQATEFICKKSFFSFLLIFASFKGISFKGRRVDAVYPRTIGLLM